MIFTAIPLSAIGGIFALWLRGMPFSISAGVGFIALFGVSVLNGIVLIAYFNQLKKEGVTDIYERIKEGTKVRLRPVILTASVASLGFLPMALSSSAGAEVQKPLATVVIGGLLTATILTLIILPILYYYFEKGFMKTKKTAVISILVLAFFSGSMNAQETPKKLSLKEALEFATKNNLTIQSSELENKMYSELTGSAYDLPKTEIIGQFGQINTNAQDKNFSISQSFSPFQYGAKKKLLVENSNLSQLKTGVTKQEIAFNIRQSWNALLYYSELNKMLQKQNNLMQKFVRSASLRFQTGETNSLEKTTAEAKQQELEQKIKHNEAMIWVEKSKIKTFLNRQENFASSDTSFVALPTLGILDSTLVKENPNVKLASQQVNVAEANRKVEKSTLMPDISAGYFIQSLRGNQEVNGQTVYYDGTPRFQGFSVVISLPIFAGSTMSKIQASKTNIEIQQKNADYLKLELSNHYQQQIQQLNTFQSLVDYYKNTALANAELITKNAGKAYQNGDVSYVEYVQALETSLAIRTNYINAIHNFNQTVINLQFLVNQ